MNDQVDLERENKALNDVIRAFGTAWILRRPTLDLWKLIAHAIFAAVIVTCTLVQQFVTVPQINEAVDKVAGQRAADSQRARAMEAMRQKELMDLADIAVSFDRLKRKLKDTD